MPSISDKRRLRACTAWFPERERENTLFHTRTHTRTYLDTRVWLSGDERGSEENRRGNNELQGQAEKPSARIREKYDFLSTFPSSIFLPISIDFSLPFLTIPDKRRAPAFCQATRKFNFELGLFLLHFCLSLFLFSLVFLWKKSRGFQGEKT